jgi:Cytochrome c oxidase subunit IV
VNEAIEKHGVRKEIHLPHPSVWPIVLAAGIALLLFGVVTSLAFSAVGAIMIVVALAGWIGELRHG